MVEYVDKMVVNVKYQIDDWANRCLPSEYKSNHWNDYPIARIIVVAAAIKYLVEGFF